MSIRGYGLGLDAERSEKYMPPIVVCLSALTLTCHVTYTTLQVSCARSFSPICRRCFYGEAIMAL